MNGTHLLEEEESSRSASRSEDCRLEGERNDENQREKNSSRRHLEVSSLIESSENEACQRRTRRRISQRCSQPSCSFPSPAPPSLRRANSPTTVLDISAIRIPIVVAMKGMEMAIKGCRREKTMPAMRPQRKWMDPITASVQRRVNFHMSENGSRRAGRSALGQVESEVEGGR